MRVMIFEPIFSGHRYTYVRLLVAALLEIRAAGRELEIVLAVSPRGLASEPFKVQLEPLVARGVRVETCAVEGAGLFGWGAANLFADSLVAACERVGPDHVLVPFGDLLVQVLGWRELARRGRRLSRVKRAASEGADGGRSGAGMMCEALLLSAPPVYGGGLKDRLRNWFWLAMARRSPLERVHYLDEGLRPWVAGDAKFAWMPDPVRAGTVCDRVEARRRLGIGVEGRIAGCVGGIDTRKGADVLVRAFAHARRVGLLRAEDRLLLAGPVAPAVREVLNEVCGVGLGSGLGAGGVEVLDRYVSDEELDLAVAAMDVVCTLYPMHKASASIVIRAAAAGRMVLGSDRGWIGRTVRAHGLGRVTGMGSVGEVAEALAGALKEAGDAGARGGETGAFVPGGAGRAWAAEHTPERFAACWTVLLRERLGIDRSMVGSGVGSGR